MTRLLRLKASDAEDLQILSSRVQDGLAQLKNVAWLPRERRFALLINRFRGERGGKPTRVRAALRFDGVSKVQSRNVKLGAGEAVISLLAVTFTPDGPEDPAGTIELVLSGGGVLRLKVECIEAELTDLTLPWRAVARPRHEDQL
ncbi:MAG: DUF2948 family protein [Rhizomicrobium sp.]